MEQYNNQRNICGSSKTYIARKFEGKVTMKVKAPGLRYVI